MCAAKALTRNFFYCAGADSVVNISQRIISPEPMYVIMNLGISPGFGKVCGPSSPCVVVLRRRKVAVR